MLFRAVRWVGSLALDVVEALACSLSCERSVDRLCEEAKAAQRLVDKEAEEEVAEPFAGDRVASFVEDLSGAPLSETVRGRLRSGVVVVDPRRDGFPTLPNSSAAGVAPTPQQISPEPPSPDVEAPGIQLTPEELAAAADSPPVADAPHHINPQGPWANRTASELIEEAESSAPCVQTPLVHALIAHLKSALAAKESTLAANHTLNREFSMYVRENAKK